MSNALESGKCYGEKQSWERQLASVGMKGTLVILYKRFSDVSLRDDICASRGVRRLQGRRDSMHGYPKTEES